MWVESRGTSWRGGYRTAEGRKVSKSFLTEAEARRWAEVAEAAEFGVVDLVKASADDGMTVGEYAQEWLARRTGKGRKTMQTYALQAGVVAGCPIAGIALTDLTRGDVELLFAALDRDPSISISMRNRRLSYLRMILKQAVLDGALILTPARPDPTGGVSMTKGGDGDLAFDDDDPDVDDDEQGRWLPPEVIEALLSAAGDPQWQFGNRKGPARTMFGEGQFASRSCWAARPVCGGAKLAALGRNAVRVVDGVTEVHIRRSLSGEGGHSKPLPKTARRAGCPCRPASPRRSPGSSGWPRSRSARP